MSKSMFESGVLSTSADKSPYAAWNKVFVPYCTGDVHSGSKIAEYSSGTETKSWYHYGRKNVDAFMKRIVPTFTGVQQLTVSGSSAGGYGALFNYAFIRDSFPKAESDLVNDAGPPLPPASVRPALRDAFATSWGSADAIKDVCAECATDWPKLIGALAKRYPADRMALLSSLQDETIRTFMDLTPVQMEEQLRSLAKTYYDPLPTAKYFYVSGEVHTFLGSAAATTSEGKSLNDWLKAMLDGSDAWQSVLPAAMP